MKIDLTKTHDVNGVYESIDWSDIRSKYRDAGTKYAFDVMDNNIVAGYHIKLACFRHLRDLQRQDTDGFPYHYDVDEANNILLFASVCPEMATHKPVKLLAWQKFILTQLVGWRNNLGDKRFTTAIISVARHNGKTYLMSIITVYSVLIEAMNESSQDFLVSSINYKQTSKLFGYVKSMLLYLHQTEPWGSLMDDLGISLQTLRSQADQIALSNTGGFIRAITYKSGQYDSFHFKTAILDEAGDPEVSDDTKINKITSGQALGVKSKQFIQISTAYPDALVPFHLDEKRVIQSMEQDYKRDADTYLVLDWSQDDENEMYKPETWEKSNPLLAMKDQRDSFMYDLNDQKNKAELKGIVNDFQNKTMNVWTQQSADSFLKYADIQKAKTDYFDIRGHQVYVGFDYSMASDNTGIGFVIPYTDEHGTQRFYAWQHSFIPWQQAGSIEAKEKQDGMNYRELAKKGFCTITSHQEGLINPDQVYSWLTNYIEENDLNVVFFGYDSMGVNRIIKALELNTDYPLEPIRQRTSELKDPTKYLQRLFVEGNISIPDDPVLEKALTNAQIYEDKIGIQVSKAAATFKIDVVDALIDALYQGMYHFEDYGYTNDKSHQVERMTAQQVKEWFHSQESGLLYDD